RPGHGGHGRRADDRRLARACAAADRGVSRGRPDNDCAQPVAAGRLVPALPGPFSGHRPRADPRVLVPGLPGRDRCDARPRGGVSTRESVPFRLVTADGEAIDLSYSSPRPAGEHDERALLDETPWFEPGKPLRNWMLHETDFYDEVEQIWGTRW